ncbi:MAG: hypothetical protein ABI721_01335 [Candidatus Dojkabacteria bacterium]
MDEKPYKVIGTPQEENGPVKHVSLKDLLDNSRDIGEMTLDELLIKVEKTAKKLNDLNEKLHSDTTTEEEKVQLDLHITLMQVELKGVISEFRETHQDQAIELGDRMEALMKKMLADENQSEDNQPI